MKMIFKFSTVVIIVFTQASNCPENTVGNGTLCADINECANGDSFCSPNELCVNEWGSFRCEELNLNEGGGLIFNHYGMSSFKCPQGSNESYYRLDYESFIADLAMTCVDIDECDNGEHDCAPDEECVNVWLSYECSKTESIPATIRTTSTITTATATNEISDGISDGILAGIIVPSIIFMSLIFLGICFCLRRNQARKIMPERRHIQETSQRATSDYNEPYEDEMYTVPYANNIYAVYQV